jgi:hypothetical protein
MNKISQQALQLWALDLRALAVFRIGAGALLLFSSFSETIPDSSSRALLEIGFRVALFIFALGWYTPVAKILVWGIFSFKLYEQMGGGYYGFKILSTMLFWSLFLPLGARYSIDEARSAKREELSPRGILSLASKGLLLQLALIYFSGGITKSLECWLLDGGALRATLRGPTGYAPFAAYLLPYEGFLSLLSRSVYVAEVLFPLFLFVPVHTARIRIFVAAVFVSMHLGIAAFMQIGIFPYLCVFVWALVLPAVFWDYLEAKLRRVRAYAEDAVLTQPNRLLEGAALVAITFVVLCAIEQWFGILGPEAFRIMRLAGLVIGLDQRWIMFNDPCGTWPD